MLEPSEKIEFDGLVARLCIEDPRFLRRVGRIGRPKRRMRLAAAILLWTIAPFCIVFGGWTGLIFAVMATSYGAFLYARRGWAFSVRRAGTAPA